MTISSVDAGIELSSSQPIRDAVKLKASNGGVSLVSEGSYGVSLVTTASPITLSASGSASGFALAANSDDDHLTIALTGTHQAELNINSDGTTTDAIVINAKVG